jgi:hypothetical protein
MTTAALERAPAAKEVALSDLPDPVLAMMERLASNKDVDVEKLKALIDMQKDILAVNAKAAFNSAFAKMQPRIPTIEERSKTDKATYAALEDIVEVVRPILSEFGFSLNHRTEFLPERKMKIVGVLTHEQGHSQESEFVCEADQTGSKNAIQALGSSNHYGRRYTTKDLLNIVTRHGDDDGEKSEPRKAVEAPEGFDDWLGDMDALVVGGADWKAYSEAWNGSKESFRLHLAKTNKVRIEAWKKACADRSKPKGGARG